MIMENKELVQEFYSILYWKNTKKIFSPRSKNAIINWFDNMNWEWSDEELCKYIYDNKLDITRVKWVGTKCIKEFLDWIKLILNK